jgi:hypothetical protein
MLGTVEEPEEDLIHAKVMQTHRPVTLFTGQ